MTIKAQKLAFLEVFKNMDVIAEDGEEEEEEEVSPNRARNGRGNKDTNMSALKKKPSPLSSATNKSK